MLNGENEAREILAGGLAVRMMPLFKKEKLPDGRPLVSVADDLAFREFLEAVFLEIINSERGRKK